jgi:hypothetical protein
MSNIKVSVQDGNNVNLQVTPQPRIDLRVDKGGFGPTGPQGATGPQGNAGTGLQIDLVVPTVADLPPTATVGYTVLVQSNQHIYVWSA